MSKRMRMRIGGALFGATASFLVVAAAAWACTTAEGTITVTDTGNNTITGADFGDSIKVAYLTPTNMDTQYPAGYPYWIILAADPGCTNQRGGDTAASPSTSAPFYYELGEATAVSGSFAATTVTLPGQPDHNNATVGSLTKLCVMSKAIYDETVPITSPDRCNGFTATTRVVDCTQANLTNLSRRGQVINFAVL